MAVAVAVAVSGGVAVPVAVPVAGLTKRFFHQKDFLINVWGYNLKRTIMVQQVWHALVNVQMLKMHARANAIPETASARANAMRQLVIASPPASNPAPLPC